MCSGRGESLRAVFFDAGGTLFAPNPSVGHIYAQVLRRFGRSLDAEGLQPRFKASWERSASHLADGQDRFSAIPGGARAFWRRLLDDVMRSLGEPALAEREFDAVYDEFCHARSYRLYPETRAVLEELTRQGLVLGVISNWDGRLPDVLEELGLAPYFAVTVVSGLEGYEKPARELFRRACARAQVTPPAALHVGDARREDYEGARAAGLRALLLDRRARGAEGDSVNDLAGVLERVGALHPTMGET